MNNLGAELTDKDGRVERGRTSDIPSRTVFSICLRKEKERHV